MELENVLRNFYTLCNETDLVTIGPTVNIELFFKSCTKQKKKWKSCLPQKYSQIQDLEIARSGNRV